MNAPIQMHNSGDEHAYGMLEGAGLEFEAVRGDKC